MKNKWIKNSGTGGLLKHNTKYYFFLKKYADGTVFKNGMIKDGFFDTNKNGTNFLRQKVGKSLNELGFVRVN